jgi:hypothetical protein
MTEEDELTTVATFSTRAEADLAKDHLESEGVDAYVLGDLTAGVMPFLPSSSAIRVQVPTDQLEKAREVLGLGEPPAEGSQGS